jgi:hypothetical protein
VVGVRDSTAAPPPTGAGRAESRWPMGLAVITAALLHAILPVGLRIEPGWAVVGFVVAVLGVLIAGDPGRIDRRRRWLALTTGSLVGFITLVNCWSALELVVGILNDASFTQPEELLLSGGVVWFTNVIAFALWYWTLDQGGPAQRFHGTGTSPAFVFPEMVNPQHAGESWYPKFVDYFSFSFATATAFSPTDVSAIKAWAKLLMVLEATVSLVVAGLVIARAVNVLQ